MIRRGLICLNNSPPNNPVESACAFAPIFIFMCGEQRIELSSSQSFILPGRLDDLIPDILYRVWQCRVFVRILWGLRTKGILGPYCEEHCLA